MKLERVAVVGSCKKDVEVVVLRMDERRRRVPERGSGASNKDGRKGTQCRRKQGGERVKGGESWLHGKVNKIKGKKQASPHAKAAKCGR